MIISASEKSPTLRQVLEDYLSIKTLKPRSAYDLKYSISRFLSDWLDRDITTIKRHECLAKMTELRERGGTQANKVMRNARALWNFAKAFYVDDEDEPVVLKNPIEVLGALNGWAPNNVKAGRLKPEQVHAWVQSVNRLERVFRDWLLFIFYTGVRRSEAVKLRWCDVDFEKKTFTLLHTKNGSDVVLPMPDVLRDLMWRRYCRLRHPSPSLSCFARGAKPIQEHHRDSYHLVAQETGFMITPHDLRRGYISTALSMGVPEIRVKALTNHKQKNTSNMTARYDCPTPDELRLHANIVANELYRLATMPTKETATG